MARREDQAKQPGLEEANCGDLILHPVVFVGSQAAHGFRGSTGCIGHVALLVPAQQEHDHRRHEQQERQKDDRQQRDPDLMNELLRSATSTQVVPLDGAPMRGPIDCQRSSRSSVEQPQATDAEKSAESRWPLMARRSSSSRENLPDCASLPIDVERARGHMMLTEK